MTQYNGYYIDHVYFHSKAEIDNHIKEQAVESFKRLHRYFAEHPTMAVSIRCSEEADRLHNIFGFSWEEIEAMEIAAIA